MKILLINPSQEKVYGMKMAQIYPPLGLLQVGAILRKEGHEVRFLDVDVERLTPASFAGHLKEFSPRVVALTSVTPTIKDALSWAGEAKRHDQGILVVVGGIHATLAPDELITDPRIDIVVLGEGERTAVELTQAIEKGGDGLSHVRGIVYKSGGAFRRSGDRPLEEDLDSLPFPDRSLLRSLGDYVPPDAERTPVATIMTSRGCPGDCTFCCSKRLFTRRVRLRSVENILAEIDLLVKEYGVKEIHIADDTFTISKSRVLAFCEGVKTRGYGISFEFMNGIRADCVDEEILGALRSIKVRNVGFGVESGSPEVLKIAKKNISIEKVREAFKLAKKFGFETWAFFIIGLPGETPLTVRQSIRLAVELDPDFVKFLILKPYPGSEVFNYLSERGLIDDYDYDNYGVYTPPVHHLPGMTKDEMVAWQKRAFSEFYFRPSTIIKHIRRIRSFTQLKLTFRGMFFVIFNIFSKKRK